jgi:hypothetical protein
METFPLAAVVLAGQSQSSDHDSRMCIVQPTRQQLLGQTNDTVVASPILFQKLDNLFFSGHVKQKFIYEKLLWVVIARQAPSISEFRQSRISVIEGPASQFIWLGSQRSVYGRRDEPAAAWCRWFPDGQTGPPLRWKRQTGG